MVEIAISLAVVSFALVAIVGVLPTGLQVQRDNREETLVNADGAYLMEALRNGEDRLGLLRDSVYYVSVNFKNGTREQFINDQPRAEDRYDGQRLIGLLGTPRSSSPQGVSNVVAWVRALSGTAIDRDPDARDLAFRYQLVTEIQPFMGFPPGLTNRLSTNELARLNQLQSGLHEVRLTFRWPLFNDNVQAPQNVRVGTRRRTFRALVGGSQLFYPTNFAGGGDHLVYYLQPSTY